MASDLLSPAAIRDGLGTGFVGQNVVYIPQTGSTNDDARRLARQGAPEGTLVITEFQSTGRGRLDRSWVAPRGSSLLMSILFRPNLAPHQVQRLTMSCGLAVAGAIQAQTGLRVDLKWPNDLVIGGAKVGGILTEIGLEGANVDYTVVGIGLNANMEPAQLPASLHMPATSLSHHVGAEVARLPLLRALLRRVEERYLALRTGWSPHRDWAARLVTLGKPVTVTAFDLVLEGTAEDVDADGALLVRLADGRLERVLAGDVSIRPQG
jgi:BirA family biotin operon repressor/biotin-[acetyl-CoA-carboxylase] ligase